MHQFSFDPIDQIDNGLTPLVAHKIARQERDAALRDYRKQGVRCVGWALRGQVRPYRGLGQADGTTRTVYMLNVADGPYQPIG